MSNVPQSSVKNVKKLQNVVVTFLLVKCMCQNAFVSIMWDQKKENDKCHFLATRQQDNVEVQKSPWRYSDYFCSLFDNTLLNNYLEATLF